MACRQVMVPIPARLPRRHLLILKWSVYWSSTRYYLGQWDVKGGKIDRLAHEVAE